MKEGEGRKGRVGGGGGGGDDGGGYRRRWLKLVGVVV